MANCLYRDWPSFLSNLKIGDAIAFFEIGKTIPSVGTVLIFDDFHSLVLKKNSREKEWVHHGSVLTTFKKIDNIQDIKIGKTFFTEDMEELIRIVYVNDLYCGVLNLKTWETKALNYYYADFDYYANFVPGDRKKLKINLWQAQDESIDLVSKFFPERSWRFSQNEKTKKEIKDIKPEIRDLVKKNFFSQVDEEDYKAAKIIYADALAKKEIAEQEIKKWSKEKQEAEEILGEF